jgi:hypothetical protein
MTRKTGFKLVYSAYHRNPSKGDIRTFSGEIMLVKGRSPVCKIKFWVDTTHIYISDVDTASRHKRCGYGRLMMEYMMFVAEMTQMPIFLYSVDSSVGFYEKLGMEHLNTPKMKRRFVIINENPECPHEWSDTDFVWIPQCLRRKRRLRVYA